MLPSAARLNDINRYGSIWRQVDAILVYFCCFLSYRKVWVQFCWVDISYFWAKLGVGRYFPMCNCAQFGPIYRPCFPTSMTFLTCVLIGWNMWNSQSYLLCEPSHILSEKKRELGSLVSTSSLVSSAFISIYMMYKFFVRSSHCCTWASQYAHVF